MDTGGLIIIFRKIGDLEDAFCRPYIFRRRSQRVAATVSQNPIYSATVTLSSWEAALGAILLMLMLIFMLC